jgi:hypothetical protein
MTKRSSSWSRETTTSSRASSTGAGDGVARCVRGIHQVRARFLLGIDFPAGPALEDLFEATVEKRIDSALPLPSPQLDHQLDVEPFPTRLGQVGGTQKPRHAALAVFDHDELGVEPAGRREQGRHRVFGLELDTQDKVERVAKASGGCARNYRGNAGAERSRGGVGVTCPLRPFS